MFSRGYLEEAFTIDGNWGAFQGQGTTEDGTAYGFTNLNGWAEPGEEPGAIKMVNLLCGQPGRKWQQSATRKNLSQLFQHYFTLAENYFLDFLDMENIEGSRKFGSTLVR